MDHPESFLTLLNVASWKIHWSNKGLLKLNFACDSCSWLGENKTFDGTVITAGFIQLLLVWLFIFKISIDVKAKCYTSLVQSQLDYTSFTWDEHTKTNSAKEGLQIRDCVIKN